MSERGGLHVNLSLPFIPEEDTREEHSHHSPRNSRNRKNHHITAKRCWNRLSRLQKSVILMSFLILLGFSSLLALTWTSPPPGGGGDHDHASLILTEDSKRLSWQLERVKVNNNGGGGIVPAIGSPDLEKDDHHNNNGGEREEDVDNNNVLALDPVVRFEEHEQPFKNIGKEQDQSQSVINQQLISHPNDKKMKFSGPTTQRQKAVVEAFLHAWKGYKTYAWGQDHLRPISGSGQDWFGLGLTLIDSLDTMYIMNLEKEFAEAKDWVESSLSFEVSQNVNLFETTIRVLGGLLSAYHLSGDPIFLSKAQELGSILIVGFNSPSGVPYSDVNLRTKTAHGPAWNPDSTTSEVTTIQMEFRDLSRITGNSEYERKAMNVSTHVHKLHKLQGLIPIYISPNTGQLRQNSVITLGARGDSYYEYLVKQWIQTGKKIDFLRDDYLTAVEGIRNLLVQRTKVSNLTFIGELENNAKFFKPKMDHLVCYLPGTLALGVLHGLPSWHMDLAKSLLYTCYLTYKRQPTGLAPEITFFHTDDDSETDFFVKSNDAHNLLRPETVESLWYLWQITGDKKYQDWGWEIFQSFLKYTQVPNGFTSISSVLNPDNTRPRDMMESFFLGETLKYFYLLFSDKPIFALDKWVFNTEAHPLPIRDQ